MKKESKENSKPSGESVFTKIYKQLAEFFKSHEPSNLPPVRKKKPKEKSE